MAARGTAQRPNGAVQGKICQFKLVLLGENFILQLNELNVAICNLGKVKLQTRLAGQQPHPRQACFRQGGRRIFGDICI